VHPNKHIGIPDGSRCLRSGEDIESSEGLLIPRRKEGKKGKRKDEGEKEEEEKKKGEVKGTRKG